MMAEQIAEDGVAFYHLPEDPALRDGLAAAVDGRAGFVVAPPGIGNHRDLAQDVLLAVDDAAGVDTVIVRSPESAAAVSTDHSRAAIESAQWRLVDEPDYVAAADDFLTAVSGFGVPWLPVAALAAAVVVAAVAWTYLSVNRTSLTGKGKINIP